MVHQAVGVLMAALGVEALAATGLVADRAGQLDLLVTELAEFLVDQTLRVEEIMGVDASSQ